jgi:hypothetical protein
MQYKEKLPNADQASLECVICSLNVTRQFTIDDIGTAGLERGWQLPTINGVVNTDPEAVMCLFLKHSVTRCRLEVSGHPICRPGYKVGIECFANGYWIGYWHVDADQNTIMACDIEPELLQSVPSASYLRLVWNFTCWRNSKREMEDVHFTFNSILFKERWRKQNYGVSKKSDNVVGPYSGQANLGEFAADPDIRLLCIDSIIFPDVSGDWYKFRLSNPLDEVVLCSHSLVPSDVGISPDKRQLGVAVAEILVDARRVSLDHWSLRDGWHAIEDGCRWTNGAARLLLPAKSKVVNVRIVRLLSKCDI